MVLCDKMAVLQVLGCLLRKPVLMSDREYKLTVDDFPEQFHKIVFGAIEHLGGGRNERNRTEHIDAIEVDQFLSPYTGQYKVFCDNRGVEYVERASRIAEENNFSYYYTTLKKYSLVNKMREEGFDTKELYDEALTDPRDITTMLDRFNKYTLNDMLDIYSGKLAVLKQNFGKAEGIVETKAGDFLEELLEKFEETPDVGLPLVSPKMTTIFSENFILSLRRRVWARQGVWLARLVRLRCRGFMTSKRRSGRIRTGRRSPRFISPRSFPQKSAKRCSGRTLREFQKI